MSKAIAFRSPTARARNRDAATPPAGPETAMASGRRRATAADIMPPLDWSRWSVAPTPARASEASRSARYRSAIGMTAAFRAVVDVRSYSRNSALISCDTETNGTCPSSAARRRVSCSGYA
jgi:hypothetical protein